MLRSIHLVRRIRSVTIHRIGSRLMRTPTLRQQSISQNTNVETPEQRFGAHRDAELLAKSIYQSIRSENLESVLQAMSDDPSRYQALELVVSALADEKSMEQDLKPIWKYIDSNEVGDTNDQIALRLKMIAANLQNKKDLAIQYGERILSFGKYARVPVPAADGYYPEGFYYKSTAAVLGDIYLSKGDLDLAFKTFEKAIEVDCDQDTQFRDNVDREALNSCIHVLLYMQQRRHGAFRKSAERASQLADLVFERQPNDPRVIMANFVVLGFLPSEANPMNKATKYFNQIMSLEGDDEELILHKGHACTFVSRNEDAINYFNVLIATSKNPDIKQKAVYSKEELLKHKSA
jgi:tetratricopeptide (TPR) repeat protein